MNSVTPINPSAGLACRIDYDVRVIDLVRALAAGGFAISNAQGVLRIHRVQNAPQIEQVTPCNP